MTHERNEQRALLEFLETAGAAALESCRVQRRLDELKNRRDALKTRKGVTARRMKNMLEAEYKREFEVLTKELDSYRRVEAFIDRIPDSFHRLVLRRRYLDRAKNWNEIRIVLEQDGLRYSPRHLTRLHTEAMEAACLLWNREREEEHDKERR